MRGQTRRLRSELVRCQEGLEHTQKRVAYALSQVAELQRRLPSASWQTAAPGSRESLSFAKTPPDCSARSGPIRHPLPRCRAWLEVRRDRFPETIVLHARTGFTNAG
jgi:hypothetical protein